MVFLMVKLFMCSFACYQQLYVYYSDRYLVLARRLLNHSEIISSVREPNYTVTPTLLPL